jgi:hypothetical protein
MLLPWLILNPKCLSKVEMSEARPKPEWGWCSRGQPDLPRESFLVPNSVDTDEPMFWSGDELFSSHERICFSDHEMVVPQRLCRDQL